MSLVDADVAPVELLDYGLLTDAHLVRCDAYIPFSRHHHVADESCLREKRRVMLKHIINVETHLVKSCDKECNPVVS